MDVLEPQPTLEVLRASYRDLQLIEPGTGGLCLRGLRDGHPLRLRVWPGSPREAARIPKFLDGPARARHPGLAPVLSLKYRRQEGWLILEQAVESAAAEADPIDTAGALGRAARAIAYLHQQGWAHGALSASALGLDTDPIWFDLGVAHLADEPPTPAADVRAFLALAQALPLNSAAVADWLASEAAYGLVDAAEGMTRIAETLERLSSQPYETWPRSPRDGAVDRWIDHYRVLRKLGEGGMAEVFLARDTVLGRSVAIKLLPSASITHDERARLVEEARATARFSHPNIVVLYGIGEHRGRPYLALEYLPGESLAEVLAKGALPAPEVIRIGLGVGRALAEAHRHDLLHCDLKPANVLIADDGRPRVLDFGLARAVQGAGQGRISWSGTPAYMSPEQRTGEALSPATDVWALGMIMFEALTGRLPAPTASGLLTTPERPEAERLPDGLADLVADCLTLAPDGRPPLRRVLDRLERYGGAGLDIDQPVGPFVGLAPLEGRHARFFAGREGEVARLVGALETASCIAIVGHSGVGKSSFVRAGVIPRLREADSWLAIDVRPGPNPFRALAAQLLSTESGSSARREDAATLAQRLRDNPGLLNLRLHDLAEGGHRVLLLVDQLEELLTHPQGRTEATDFLSAIAGATDGPDDDAVRVLVTLREDFIGRISEVGPAVLEHLFALSAPGVEMLTRCIETPLAAVGYRLDPPHLIHRMVQDLRGSSAPLPLLQFGCARLWEERDEAARILHESAYDEMGGLQGALASHADEQLRALSPSQLRDARPLLTRLVGPDGTRRVVSYPDLTAGLTNPDPVLAQLMDARLVASRRGDDEDDAAAYELVHESLTRTWGQLSRWLAETREERALVNELEEAARPWHRRGERPEETWSGPVLERALTRIDALGLTLQEPAARFVAVGAARERRRKWRRRATVVGALLATSLLALASTAAAIAFRRQVERFDRASANLGRFELRLQVFDIDPESERPQAVAAGTVPDVSWTLHEVDPEDATQPGPPVDPRFFTMRAFAGSSSAALGWTVETRGGPGFLRVTGRGRGDARCAPAWVPLRRLPGYTERVPIRTLTIRVPSCQASLVNMKRVPAGPFIRGGPGVPPSPDATHVDPEKEIELPTFWMDTYEISNRRLAELTDQAEVTGWESPIYPRAEGYTDLARPTHPAVQIHYALARAYCAFHGKRLPTSNEWEKAARGGLWLDAGRTIPNPLRRRSFPWGEAPLNGRVNLDGHEEDGYWGTAPIDAFPDGASPYGLLGLAGNAAEWTQTPVQGSPGMLHLRGANWAEPEPFAYLAYENSKARNMTNLGIGARCAWSPTVVQSGE